MKPLRRPALIAGQMTEHGDQYISFVTSYTQMGGAHLHLENLLDFFVFAELRDDLLL